MKLYAITIICLIGASLIDVRGGMQEDLDDPFDNDLAPSTNEQTGDSAVLVDRGYNSARRLQRDVLPSARTGTCRCPGANLHCVRQEMRNSTDGSCPPCPTSCSTPAPPECGHSKQCASGRECEIEEDSSYKCLKESGEGENCRYTDNCLDREECENILSGRKVEKMCSPGLFCRKIHKGKCVVFGVCVNITSASNNEARCLRNSNVTSSRCSLDGNYLCSSTEKKDARSLIQTCYNITSGKPLKVVRRRSEADVSQEYCRRRNLKYCRTHNGITVISGDKVDDPNSRCSYCLCKDGVIDRTMCKTNPRCVQSPNSCTVNGRTIPHGRVVSSQTSCAQMRCVNGILKRSTMDEDCDGRDDVDECSKQQDSELVCAKLDSGIRARISKCKAVALGESYSHGRCGEDRVCNCSSDEICVPIKRPRDMCIMTEDSGCNSTKCISINSNITCSTGGRYAPVCSSSGVTYRSECEAFVNQDFDIKYLRACDDQLCQADNNGEGFCGFDKQTYNNLCDLELATGSITPDYFGSCVLEQSQLDSKCAIIPPECSYTTKSSDSMCPIAGAQGILHIDVDEVHDYAFRKGKSEVDLKDLCREVESDWEILTNYSLFDDRCEFSCRLKYDTIGAIVVQVKAVSGAHCAECGERLSVFIRSLRDDKAGDTSTDSNRKRRQTDGSGSMGSGLFISPSDLENDPSFQSGACSLIASLTLTLASIMLALCI